MIPPNGLPASIALLVQELRGLLRVELALARAEIEDGARGMAIGVALIALAGMLGFIGLVVMAGAVVLALHGYGFSWLHAALITGGAALLIAALAAYVGIRRVKPQNLVPKRAMANLRADVHAAAEAPHVPPY